MSNSAGGSGTAHRADRGGASHGLHCGVAPATPRAESADPPVLVPPTTVTTMAESAGGSDTSADPTQAATTAQGDPVAAAPYSSLSFEGRLLGWKALVAAAAVNLVITLMAAVAAAVDGSGRPQLAILFGICGLLNLASALLSWRSPHGIPMPSLDRGSRMLLVAAYSFFLQLAVRLILAPRQFGGTIGNFDFGVKCSPKKGCSGNISFDFHPDALGHCVQGTLVLFLFPVTGSVVEIARGKVCIQKCLMFLREVTTICFPAYTLYNILKRAVQDVDSFASSSYCNNMSEWVMGVLLGCSFALLLTCMARDTPIIKSEDVLSAGLARALCIGRIISGVVLCVAALAAALLLGLTWDNVPKEASTGIVHEDSEDTMATLVLTAIPFLVAGVVQKGLIKKMLTKGARRLSQTVQANDGSSAPASVGTPPAGTHEI